MKIKENHQRKMQKIGHKIEYRESNKRATTICHQQQPRKNNKNLEPTAKTNNAQQKKNVDACLAVRP